ncbi:2-oxo-tetronate isomerase [Bartonella tamiae]|uniref:Xylose isomerase-like TIM barrel domain-containing protein n=1 Tax=Bartonella tamiae Th239 TaxID=1094558 RepID=J0QTR5_9HYPH|nr:2-oxo-tetronate isomerase [Bartonella tamiae]EJF89301.1 hypothetical protein ME5_01852 [Bartonella tamiae Th239]EJF95537.1 hypothetical protein MEG_00027 [Bartonella tamiae Th307]
MPRFAANLSMMFTEVPFLDRFSKAAEAGFEAVEFLFPYDYAPEILQAELRKNQLKQALFNMPPGQWDLGERGLAALPGREVEFRKNVDKALEYALALDCQYLHAMSGLMNGHDRANCEKTFIDNFRYASDRVAEYGISVLVEPINTRNMPGYFINHQLDAVSLLEKVARKNVFVQYDLYHAQIMDGDLTILTEKMKGKFAHVQIASVPDRHEPDEGEVNFSHLFKKLDDMGYEGFIGCEYHPRGHTVDGLAWFEPYRKKLS